MRNLELGYSLRIREEICSFSGAEGALESFTFPKVVTSTVEACHPATIHALSGRRYNTRDIS